MSCRESATDTPVTLSSACPWELKVWRISEPALIELRPSWSVHKWWPLMRPEDRDALVRLYEDRFQEMGEDIRTLGWKNREEQNLRFKILCDVGDLRGASICDVGCGFGDLLDYLRSTVGDVQYTGIDIAPSLLDRARQKHPEARFYCLNLANEAFDEEHDYFLLSGALSYKVADNMALTERMLRRSRL